MVIIKIKGDSGLEREIEIVNEDTWTEGSYRLFAAHFINKAEKSREPHDVNSERYLGEILVSDKLNSKWKYNGEALYGDEQKQVARFILDYSAPDGVY